MSRAPSTTSLLVFVAATHFLVDSVAGTLNPLWPRLDGHYELVGWQSAGLLFLWQMTTSVSQLFFGIYGDRYHARWLVWMGPLAAIVCLGSIGLTSSVSVLAALLSLGGLGIAAYHPEAAALVGESSIENRSRAMSIFTMGGFLGQATGPIYSGVLVDRLGLAGMPWTILIGVIAAVAICPWGQGLGLANPSQHAHCCAPRLRDVVRGRWSILCLLLSIGSLRIIAMGGVPILVGFLLQTQGASGGETGAVQSAFMVGTGLGGLTCATLVRRHYDRLILWLCPLVASPVLIAIPWVGGPLLLTAMFLSGLLLGISLPVMISTGQQLLPESQRIASSLTMGVSWGLGGAIVALVLAACKYVGSYHTAFVVFGLASTVSCVLCAWLPADAPISVSKAIELDIDY